MAEVSGTLRIAGGASSVEDTLLAVRNGLPSPIGRATQFVTAKGLRDGQPVDASGELGRIGERSTLFLGNVEAAGGIQFEIRDTSITASEAQPKIRRAAKKRRAPKKSRASKKGRARTTGKRVARKKSARTTRTRKSGRSKK